jgi:branched-subunit amino acid transport protein
MLAISKETRSKDSFLGSMIMLIVLIGIMSVVTWTAYLIPLIHNNPIFNYILNFIIHIMIIALVIIGIVTSTKKQTPNR